ncbi:hypothetical protein DPMN_110060 [Dreissena polymorpha]|uniref:Uncharacterized protein n=1 Tax=Dreissena polymorpha TaxID=45954 RepID=A0A9D4KBV7_DREPO|nr:hypothetical protein DPMN_110060 [Dreissena polymorpha]
MIPPSHVQPPHNRTYDSTVPCAIYMQQDLRFHRPMCNFHTAGPMIPPSHVQFPYSRTYDSTVPCAISIQQDL